MARRRRRASRVAHSLLPVQCQRVADPHDEAPVCREEVVPRRPHNQIRHRSLVQLITLIVTGHPLCHGSASLSSKFSSSRPHTGASNKTRDLIGGVESIKSGHTVSRMSRKHTRDYSADGMGEQIAKRSRSDGEAALVMARRREEAKAWRAAFRSPRDACPHTLPYL